MYWLLSASILCSLTLSAPIETCETQQDCLSVVRRALPYGTDIEVCLVFSPSDECKKDGTDSISHSCPSDDESEKIEGLFANVEMCRTVPCETDAVFGIKDGKGCTNSGGLDAVSLSGVDNITCSAEPYCGGGAKTDCRWTVPAGDCPTPSPTEAEFSTTEEDEDPVTTVVDVDCTSVNCNGDYGEGDREACNADPCCEFNDMYVFCGDNPDAPSSGTSTPTSAPTFSKCDSDDALNIAFLLDESASVDIDEWGVIKNFVNRIITFDISQSSSVKMWKYAAYHFFQEIQDWTLMSNGGEATLSSAILGTGYSTQGLTMTWDAVNRVLDDYWQYRFECDDGCETRADLLFLVTDGKPTGEAVCSGTTDMTTRMSGSAVDIVLVVIQADGGFDTSLISCLDTNDGGADIIELPDFDSDTFNAIEARIREKTCSGDNPAGPGDRPEDGTQWQYADGSVGLGPVPEPDRTGGAGGAGDSRAGANGGDASNGSLNTNDVNGNTNNYVWAYIVGAIAGLVIIGAVSFGVYKAMQPKGQAIVPEEVPAKSPEPTSPDAELVELPVVTQI